MKKFWTVQDGVLGTAHTSREGKTVDFRPMSRVEANVRPGGYALVVQPGKGVDCAPLVLAGVTGVQAWEPATVRPDQYLGYTFGRSGVDMAGTVEMRERVTVHASFEGVTLSATMGWPEYRLTERGQALAVAHEAGVRAGLAFRSAEAKHLAAEVRKAPTRGLDGHMLGRMRRRAPGARVAAERAVLDAYAAFYGLRPDFGADGVRKMLADYTGREEMR